VNHDSASVLPTKNDCGNSRTASISNTELQKVTKSQRPASPRRCSPFTASLQPRCSLFAASASRTVLCIKFAKFCNFRNAVVHSCRSKAHETPAAKRFGMSTGICKGCYPFFGPELQCRGAAVHYKQRQASVCKEHTFTHMRPQAGTCSSFDAGCAHVLGLCLKPFRVTIACPIDLIMIM